jgi:hypothetical protein
MNRWRQRLAELSRDDTNIPLSPAPLHVVQNVQSVQNRPPAPAFEHFERIGQSPLTRPCPDGISPERWQRACEGAKRFADEWAKKAMRLGWTFDELFTLAEPFARADLQGAAWFIGDSAVVGISATAITLRTASGATQRVYRRALQRFRAAQIFDKSQACHKLKIAWRTQLRWAERRELSAGKILNIVDGNCRIDAAEGQNESFAAFAFGCDPLDVRQCGGCRAVGGRARSLSEK